MKFLLLTRIFLALSFLTMTSLALADAVLEKNSDSNKTAESHDCESPDSKCTFIKANSGLQSIFIATASVAPALGQYSYLHRYTSSDKNFDRANFKGKANFISGDVSLGWTFIDPRTEHFSHTILLRGNLQSTLIPARLGNKSELTTSNNLYEDQSLTRTDQSLELFYKLGIKKHNFTFSLGEKQSETKFSSVNSAWRTSETLSDNAIKNKDGTITMTPLDPKAIIVKAEDGTRGQALLTTNSSYTVIGERLTTKGEFVSLGYDYLINEAQNIRLGTNVSYMKLRAKR